MRQISFCLGGGKLVELAEFLRSLAGLEGLGPEGRQGFLGTSPRSIVVGGTI